MLSSEPLRLTAFHDESATSGWFTTGILWVPTGEIATVAARLHGHRLRLNFWRESHFVKLPGSHERQNLARAWFDGFRTTALGQVYFTTIVLDRRVPNFDGTGFPEAFYEYNRFTAMALWSGYRRFWKKTPQTRIDLVSDARPRKLRGTGILGRFEGDNFAEYLPRRFSEDAASEYGSPCPLIETVRVLPSHTPRRDGEERPIEDLLQLCDLLTGATAQAFSRSSGGRIKSSYGTEFKIMANATLLPPRQRPRYCSHLAVSQFPDSEGLMRRGKFEFAQRPIPPLEEYQ